MSAGLAGEERLRGFVITIDGPSGSGKTTTARLVAGRLGFRHVDTGAMYRAVTLIARERGVDAGDAARLGEIAHALALDVSTAADGSAIVRIGNRDVSADIRSPEVTAAVSSVSAHRVVRAAMVRRQRALAERGGVILEGRDTGSVVLPWADVKIYLDASVTVRAQRRHQELRRAGVDAVLADVERDLERRDALDSSRAESPLVRPVGAWTIDTSSLSIEGQVGRLIELARGVAERCRASDRSTVRADRKRFTWVAITGLVAFLLTVLFGMRVRRLATLTTSENYIFASNHISNLDPPAVSCRLPREVYFVAKAALFQSRWFGALIRHLNAFPVRRGVFDREAMAFALSVLGRGGSLLIFPEGGRVAGGELGPARGGVGYLAVQSGVPVVPVYVSGTDRLRDCLLRRRRIEIIHGRPIRIPSELAAVYRGEDDRALYRRHSDTVMAAIQALKDGAP